MQNIIEIIKEEINTHISEFYDEESSVLDTYTQKKLGMGTVKDVRKYNGELIGTITHSPWFANRKYKDPCHIFKNPKTVKEFPYEARGVLLKNADFYLATNIEVLHNDILLFLVKKNILPRGTSFIYLDHPDDYVAVEKYKNENIFLPSTLYDEIPKKYLKIFENANMKIKNYIFATRGKSDYDVDEQLDMNRCYSYMPRELEPNRNFGRPF